MTDESSVVQLSGGAAKVHWHNAVRQWAVVLLVAVAWFGSLELRGLFVPDEGRYAEIPREMLATGDWTTPRLNDLKYFEKPPLQYWMTASSYFLLGEDEWTARLPATLVGFLALLMVWYTGYRLWDMRTGALAATMLIGSWAYFLAGQYLTLDMTLTACLTFALCCFLIAQDRRALSVKNYWMPAAWLAIALAVLSKGLVAVVLPTLTLFIYCLLKRDVGPIRRLRPILGGAVFLLVTLPWFIAVQIRNPEFFHFFFIHEHLQRFAEAGHHRPGPWWYYVPIIFVGLLPWTPAMLKEGLNFVREKRSLSAGFSPELFCVLWGGVVLLFFSASHSKLPAYVLPALPALVLVFARRLQVPGADSLRWSAWGVALVGTGLIWLVAMLPHFGKFAVFGDEIRHQSIWLYAAAGTLIASGAGATWMLRSARQGTAIALLLAGTLLSWNLVFEYLHALDAHFSSERLIESLTMEDKPFRPDVPFYTLEQFDASVLFYLGRTVTMVATRDELGPGIDAEPYKVIPTMDGFVTVWLAQKGQAFAIMRLAALAELRLRNLPMVELRSDGRLVIVSRQPEHTLVNRRAEHHLGGALLKKIGCSSRAACDGTKLHRPPSNSAITH